MDVEILRRPGPLVHRAKCKLCGGSVNDEYWGTEFAIRSPEGFEHFVCAPCVKAIESGKLVSRMLRYAERLEAEARSLRRGLKHTFIVKEEEGDPF